jgi:ubiquitin-conjugating enzyme E2 S
VENTRRRGETVEPASDPESDWIPGPNKAHKSSASKPEDGIYGTKGLDDTMQLDSPVKRPLSEKPQPRKDEGKDDHGKTDPFTPAISKRTVLTQTSFNSRITPKQSTSSGVESEAISTETREVLKFSRQNDCPAVTPSDQSHPLLREFSYSWEESELVHDTGLVERDEGRTGVKKRLASDEFEAKRTWELKRFKKAGFDLRRYNRGDFGPKTGVGRL